MTAEVVATMFVKWSTISSHDGHGSKLEERYTRNVGPILSDVTTQCLVYDAHKTLSRIGNSFREDRS